MVLVSQWQPCSTPRLLNAILPQRKLHDTKAIKSRRSRDYPGYGPASLTLTPRWPLQRTMLPNAFCVLSRLTY